MTRYSYGSATLAMHYGGFVINDTTEKTISASIVVLSPDAVVETLEINGVATNVVATYISSPASPIGGNGAMISAVDGGKITKIKLGAGTANYVV